MTDKMLLANLRDHLKDNSMSLALDYDQIDDLSDEKVLELNDLLNARKKRFSAGELPIVKHITRHHKIDETSAIDLVDTVEKPSDANERELLRDVKVPEENKLEDRPNKVQPLNTTDPDTAGVKPE